jgi:putative endonuclease
MSFEIFVKSVWSMVDSLNWSVYIIQCSDNSLYTGITTNMHRRFHQHATRQGAKYFRGRQPETLVYIESGHSRISASRREVEIKKLRRTEKLHLITSSEDILEDIF